MHMTGNSRKRNCFSGFHRSLDYFAFSLFYPALLGGSEQAEGVPAALHLLFCVTDCSRKGEASILMAILALFISSGTS